MLKNLKIALYISPNDPVDVIFGKEHSSRVRGLSYMELALPLFLSDPLEN